MKLTEIYRQAQESKIVVNAHKINNGEMVELDDKLSDFIFVRETNILNQIVKLITDRLSNLRKIWYIKGSSDIDTNQKGYCWN